MNKILILFSFLFVFSLKINAYEYVIYERANTQLKQIIYYDNNGYIWDKYVRKDGTLQSNRMLNDNHAYQHLGYIVVKRTGGLGDGYCNKLEFENYYKNDLIFLNALYNQITMPFLNFLYNEHMTEYSHIIYGDYKILYDANGLAVESIVNDVWAGLYSDSEKGVSGRLYSSGGQLLYVNGKPLNFMESQLFKLMDMVEKSLRETVDVLGSLVPVIVEAVFVLLILYYVVSVGRRAIMPCNVKVRKRFLGSHNDEC